MQGVTIAVLILAIVVAVATKPRGWVIIFTAAMAYYPNFLTIPLGTIDFNVTRIIVVVLLGLILSKPEYTKNFKFSLMDKLVVLGIIAQIISYAATTDMSTTLENRAGALLDTVLPYFLVRLVIKDWQNYTHTLKGILILMIPLAIVGAYQSITSHNPAGFLFKYHGWGLGNIYQEPRHGFYRANVTFPMSIMFGLFFAMLGPICVGLIKAEKKNKPFWKACLAFALLGTMSSMSSGPWMAAMLSIVFIFFYKYRKYWKNVLVVIVIMCIAVEIISNRHFYDVLTRFTFSSSTAWYRTRLVEVAFFEGGMAGHWLFGYGIEDPGWGMKIDYRSFTDMVNHYLLILSRYGLIGFIPFMAIVVQAIRELIKAFRGCFMESQRWLIWCLTAAMFGLLNALNTVSLFGQPSTILYMMLGLCSAMPAIVENSRRQVVLNQLNTNN